MIHVIATITAKPGQRQTVLALFQKNCAAVLAEKGCISYEAVIDAAGAGKMQTPLGEDTFAVLERWQDTAALQAHAASPHMAEYARQTAPLTASRVINVLQGAA